MSIRLPLKTVLDFTDTDVGVASTVSKPFLLPQDCDNIIVKVPVASMNGTNPTCDVILQTSDDGGTTYYDVGNLRVTGTKVVNGTALWMSAPVNGVGMKTTVSGSSSTTTGTTPVSVLGITGAAAASSLGINSISGLPILGQQNRIYLVYGGTIAVNNGVQVQVKVNSQSATA